MISSYEAHEIGLQTRKEGIKYIFIAEYFKKPFFYIKVTLLRGKL